MPMPSLLPAVLAMSTPIHVCVIIPVPIGGHASVHAHPCAYVYAHAHDSLTPTSPQQWDGVRMAYDEKYVAKKLLKSGTLLHGSFSFRDNCKISVSSTVIIEGDPQKMPKICKCITLVGHPPPPRHVGILHFGVKHRAAVFMPGNRSHPQRPVASKRSRWGGIQDRISMSQFLCHILLPSASPPRRKSTLSSAHPNRVKNT